MIGVARPAMPFAMGFDCLQPVPPDVALRARSDGMRWCGRYLETLTAEEVTGLFAAELAILPISEAMVREPLSATLGAERGAQLVRLASVLGVPRSCSVGIDFESPAPGSDCAGFIDAAAAALSAGGYGPLLYVGAPEPLSGHELYELAPTRYWRGAGDVPTPECGWCILQLEPLDREAWGHRVDYDVIQGGDRKGRLPMLWYPS